MEDFKKLPKMQSFKEGGGVNNAFCKGGMAKKKAGGAIDKGDEAQDKKLIKKAFGIHDKQLHEDEKTDLSTLRKGGRAKKETGTVRKYKAGGSVNVNEKKPSGHKDAIKKVAPTGDKKATAPSKGAVKGSEVPGKNKGASGHKDAIKKVAPTGDKKASAPSKAEAKSASPIINKKAGGGIKKMADGSLTGALGDGISSLATRLRNNVMGTPQQNAQAVADQRKRAALAAMAQSQAQAPAQGAMQAPQAPAPQQAAPAGVSSPLPAQKRGGKVKGR